MLSGISRFHHPGFLIAKSYKILVHREGDSTNVPQGGSLTEDRYTVAHLVLSRVERAPLLPLERAVSVDDNGKWTR